MKRSPNRPVRRLLVVGMLLLAASTAGGTGAAAAPTAAAAPAAIDTATADARSIQLTQELHLTPETPGEITVTLQYGIPEGVVSLQTRLPPSATVVATSGFVSRDGGEYAWDGQTSSPTVTYRMPVNQTLDAEGPIAGKGDYTFVDPGEWALVRIPPTATGWSWTGGGTVDLSRRVTTAGPGAVGDTIAYLGDHRELQHTANGQTFRLVIPAQASMAASPAAVFESLSRAAGTLQVGDRDASVFMVAAPTKNVKWGVRGLQTGGSDLWVRDSETLATPDNVWLHEYVHTRQGYATSAETRWFTEASATYYAALLTLEQGLVSFDAFRDRLGLGARHATATSVLSDPQTWDGVAPYVKGALVAGELDRQIRLASNKQSSLQAVFRQMNDHGKTVTYEDFQRMVRQAGGDTVASQSERYTRTREYPQMWDHTAHDHAFGAEPARISYTLPAAGTSGYRVSGPVRTGTLGPERPIRLAVGETLGFDVRVANVGGTAGAYDARLHVNGAPQSQRTGRLDPGQSTTLTFTHQFTRPGEYTLTVGGHTLAVSVRAVTPTVTNVRTKRQQRQRGRQSVTVLATVRNNHAYPAATNLTLYHNGAPVATQQVTLQPHESTTASFNLTLDPGEHVFQLGNQTATVAVEATATPRPTQSPTPTEAPAPGFGFSAAALGLLVAAFFGWRGR